MEYIKDAIARTDVPTDLVTLIAQRRRWLNGAFFALLYTLTNWGRVLGESRHGVIRQLALLIQYLYMVASLLITWFLPANYFLIVYYILLVGFMENKLELVDVSSLSEALRASLAQGFMAIYALVFMFHIIVGLGNKPKHIRLIYTLSCFYYAVINFAVIAVTGYLLFQQLSNFNLIEAIAIAAGFGSYFIASTLHFEVHHILLSIVQYMAFLPSYINILNTYSFCNLHDLSWGTKYVLKF